MERSDYGLSVLIPAVDERIDGASIVAAVVEDYYWPILKGQLEVEVSDGISGQHLTIDASSIDLRIHELGDIGKRLVGLVETARQVIGMQGTHPNFFRGVEPAVELTTYGAKRYKVTADCFSDENLERLKEEFEKGHMVGVSFVIPLEPKAGKESKGLLEVFIGPDTGSGSERIEQFIRKSIVISRQRTNISGKFSSCFVVAEDVDMSNYLMLAEEPAHTNWTFRLLNEKKKYKSDAALRFSMSCASDLHRILTGEDEEQDALENFAEDIFSIDKPSTEGGKKSRKRKRKRKEETDKPDVDTKQDSVPLVRVDRLDDGTGFAIVPVKQFDEVAARENVVLPIRVQVTSAYLSVRGNSRSWKDYSPIDFEFGKDIGVRIQPENAGTVLSASGNELTIEIFDADFEVKFDGFDPHRDLLIKTKIEV